MNTEELYPMKTMQYAVAAALALAAAAQAQPVKAPPLPPGSNLVRVEPGMNPEERKRHVRAHHHKGHHKKDFMRDDSLPPDAGSQGKGHAGGRK